MVFIVEKRACVMAIEEDQLILLLVMQVMRIGQPEEEGGQPHRAGAYTQYGYDSSELLIKHLTEFLNADPDGFYHELRTVIAL